jgi:hypothetical protein
MLVQALPAWHGFTPGSRYNARPSGQYTASLAGSQNLSLLQTSTSIDGSRQAQCSTLKLKFGMPTPGHAAVHAAPEARWASPGPVWHALHVVVVQNGPRLGLQQP